MPVSTFFLGAGDSGTLIKLGIFLFTVSVKGETGISEISKDSKDDKVPPWMNSFPANSVAKEVDTSSSSKFMATWGRTSVGRVTKEVIEILYCNNKEGDRGFSSPTL